ncbi:FKBP-type peptidyl-prolyl cis-trans isomerase [Aliiruegeria sabulilitoris]|uniref:FKBP-type peptidyl-prolyl cis-trans isomerase n=1 Tax=Aliiruegeria sabulilitoris TaxID=1510458 RepID=UPI00082EDDE9|nr:peptidylprolyl isomerase [Aliiruegeria sabulilitoris]NDR55035.1 peptidylprolyl isomerase [Pseudoruegeria sp. M32A2M]
MSTAKAGDTVRIHYTGTLTDGSTFDSSQGRDPLEFVIGSGQIIPGLDAAMPGMAVGENKTVSIPCAEAYGEADPSRLQQVPRGEIPDHIPLEAGLVLQAQGPDGNVIQFTVREFNDEAVTLDANHPLAGKDLIFEVELVSIG